jgi:phenylpropionate dioxygenase-like ring-hydroxylating dioxygenase large terminal subunit
MIKNQWYAILDSSEIKENKTTSAARMGEKLVLWRKGDGTIGCMSDACCHRGASLSKGEVHGSHVACPFHGFRYDSSGKVVLIPANGKDSSVPGNFSVKAYRAVDRHGFIWLWYGEAGDDTPEVPFFDYLKEGFTYGGFSEVWPVHYTRAIENQLDVVHLPFVHTDTIGRGNRTLVNGPVVEWDDNLMTFYVSNVVDDGRRPLKPEEIADYRKLFSLQFQMPNLWQNRISDNVRIVAVFAPIDEKSTRIYIRFYQNFMKVPVLREVINGISSVMNRRILHQDRDVVVTQVPIRSELNMGENLIQGDLPIIEYRKRRALLKGEMRG